MIFFLGTCGYGLETIFCSSNNGDNWIQLDVETACVIDISINSNGYIFAALGAYIIYSMDNGISWLTLNSSSSFQPHLIRFNSNDHIFVEHIEANSSLF